MISQKVAKVFSPFILFALTLTPLVTGCASHRSTTVTRTEVDEPRGRYYPEPGSEVTTTTTETHSDTEREEHHGVFHILADIIALPFRAVGAIFSSIF